jgi:plasmid replication initiation protein
MNEKELSVVKSNEIIEARYRLDVLEQKFILYLVSLINPEDTDFKNLKVKVADFERVMNVGGSKWGNIYTVVREIILSLNEKPLQIVKEDGTKLIINWISSAEIKPRTGIIHFEFSERLKPYLLQLKSRFTLYKLNNILRLNSAYSIRMYEFLKSYQYKGGVYYSVDDLKLLLGVSDKYDDYRDFKKRVLNTAQQELAKKSDICFDYKEQRDRRKIVALDFKVYENPNTPDYINPNKNKRKTKTTDVTDNNNATSPADNTVVEKLVQLQFTPTKAKDIYKKGFQNIKDDILRGNTEKLFDRVEAWFEDRFRFLDAEMQKRPIENPQGYFMKCLEENYTHLDSDKQRKTQEAQILLKQQAQIKADLEKQKKALSDDIWAEKLGICLAMLKKEPDFLDIINQGSSQPLLPENDPQKPVWENLENSPVFIRVKVITAIEKYTPQYFEHLMPKNEALTLLEKKIGRF